jgi:hypothetical protein
MQWSLSGEAWDACLHPSLRVVELLQVAVGHKRPLRERLLLAEAV